MGCQGLRTLIVTVNILAMVVMLAAVGVSLTAYGQSQSQLKPQIRFSPLSLDDLMMMNLLDSSSVTGDPSQWDQISLEQMIQLAVRSSKQSLQFQGDYHITRNQLIRTQSVYDPVVSSGVSFRNSHPDQFPRPERDSFQSLGLESSVSQSFSQGSTLSLSVKNRMDETVMSKIPDVVEPLFTTSASVAVSQSLTKNLFGVSWQLHQDIATLNQGLVKFKLAGQLDDLVEAMINTFFGLKSQKLLYESLVATTQKNKEIFSTAQLFYKRGNVVESDLLNIEARYLSAIEAEKQALIEYQNNWHLALDALGVSPDLRPKISVDQLEFSYKSLRDSDWQPLCDGQKMDDHPGYQLRKKAYEVAQKQQQLVRQNSKPDLNLSLSYMFSNVEGELSQSVADTLTGDHGAFRVGLNLKWKVNDHQSKADQWDSIIRSGQAELDLETFVSRQKVEIANSCRLVKHLMARHDNLKDIYSKQLKRAQLERQRFNIGRQDFFTATAGELAALRAKFDYDSQIYTIEKQLRTLLVLNGKMLVIED